MKPCPSRSAAPFVAVAGQSARLLAQSAVRAGLRVAALDIFGDRDTREAAEHWFDIGDGAFAIDRERLGDALMRVARLPRFIGWIAGSGLEPLMPQLCGAAGLPRLIGNGAAANAAVRDPRRFFALLDALDIAHPAVSFERPANAQGWLFKEADGCGGTHIRPAAEIDAACEAPREPMSTRTPTPAPASASAPALSPGTARGYFQRLGDGRPMSALFIGAQGRAHVIGFAEQFVCTVGDLKFVHAGSIGPVELPAGSVERIQRALDAICARTGLAGINSCDFLFDGSAFEVLEINARPSSTMALYESASPDAWPRGLLACHLDACRNGHAPSAASLALARRPRWRAGQQVLFATRPFTVSAAFSDACLRDPCCHDVPMAGVRIDAGQPVCTLLVRVEGGGSGGAVGSGGSGGSAGSAGSAGSVGSVGSGGSGGSGGSAFPVASADPANAAAAAHAAAPAHPPHPPHPPHSAQAADAADWTKAIRRALADQRARVLQRIETCDEARHACIHAPS